MGTDKRARQKAGRQQRLAAERAAHVTAQRSRRVRRLVILGAVIVVAVVGAWLLVRDGDGGGDSDDTAVPTALPVEPGATSEVAACPAEDGEAERVTSFAGEWIDAELPTCIEDGATYSAVISTSSGDISVELDAAGAAEAVNAFVILARYGYYDASSVFLTNTDGRYIGLGVPPEDASVVAPGFTIATGEGGELGESSLVLAVDESGNVGPALDAVGAGGSGAGLVGTVIGTIDSESQPIISTILDSHVPGEDITDQEAGNGAPGNPVELLRIVITQG